MIRVVRKRTGQGEKMFRVWCDECQAYCRGNGRSRYMSWWLSRNSAENASLRHFTQHRHKPQGSYMYGMQRDEKPPNDYDYQDISQSKVVPLKRRRVTRK